MIILYTVMVLVFGMMKRKVDIFVVINLVVPNLSSANVIVRLDVIKARFQRKALIEKYLNIGGKFGK